VTYNTWLWNIARSLYRRKEVIVAVFVAGERPVSGGRGGVERRPDPVRESEERPLPDGGVQHEDDDCHHEM
jgi:hypothetical protein